jgi:diguanylate cyclase (GGDEF)-like protein
MYNTQTINDLEKEIKMLTKENKKLSKIAFNDLKFKCNNRNYFECNRKYLDNKPLICIMNDVNGLKKINDSYGHNAGDIYIFEFISRAKKYLDNLQIKSKIIRLGGDEFLILILNNFELFNIDDYQKAIDNIASFGNVEKLETERLYFALKRADKLLYKNKQDFYNICK